MRAAISMLWVASTTVRPDARINCDSAWNTWSEVCGSRLPVGSSASSSARRVGDRARDRDALLLAAGELRRPVRQPLAEAEIGQQFGRRACAPRPCDEAADHLRQHDVLERGEFRQQMMQLIDEADRVAPDARCARRPTGPRSARRRDRPRRRRDARAGPAICSSVDLPAPDGATSATDCPGQIARSRALAGFPAPRRPDDSAARPACRKTTGVSLFGASAAHS